MACIRVQIADVHRPMCQGARFDGSSLIEAGPRAAPNGRASKALPNGVMLVVWPIMAISQILD